MADPWFFPAAIPDSVLEPHGTAAGAASSNHQTATATTDPTQ